MNKKGALRVWGKGEVKENIVNNTMINLYGDTGLLELVLRYKNVKSLHYIPKTYITNILYMPTIFKFNKWGLT